MARDLKDELTVPTFMQECARRGTSQGETAKHEGSSGEPEVLPVAIAILADRLEGFSRRNLRLEITNSGKLDLRTVPARLRPLEPGW